jgi:hypothetical protein
MLERTLINWGTMDDKRLPTPSTVKGWQRSAGAAGGTRARSPVSRKSTAWTAAHRDGRATKLLTPRCRAAPETASQSPKDRQEDPCHRRHSCPSDQDTYVCGDLGHCEQCPDTPYCQGGKPTPTAQQTPLPAQRPSAKVEEASCVTVQVCFTPGEDCTELIVKTLGEAKTSIFVQAYSFTSAPIAKALVDAKKRGVRVEAILDKSNRTDKYSAADFLANSGIPTLIDAQHAIAHNKVIVIDGEIVIGDSFNYTKAAQDKNARTSRSPETKHWRRSTRRIGRRMRGTRSRMWAEKRPGERDWRRDACGWPNIPGDVYRWTGTGANRTGPAGRPGPGRVCGAGGERQAHPHP